MSAQSVDHFIFIATLAAIPHNTKTAVQDMNCMCRPALLRLRVCTALPNPTTEVVCVYDPLESAYLRI